MNLRVLCFGEVLWDCLPSGKLPGGAPLNVAYHLHRLGAAPQMISAVGRDALGDEVLAYLSDLGLDTKQIRRHETLPTGTVDVTLAADGQPHYTICEGVAWDDIGLPALDMVKESAAFVFGSLAARNVANQSSLGALLDVPGPLRIMDVNLRPPFDNHGRVLALARRADWVKLNEHELAQLADGEPARFASMSGCRQICITRGERGASIWHDGVEISAPAPQVKVRDTIGAGDAFTAALVHGLLVAPEADNLPTILRRACALGALVASLSGGQPDYDPAPFSL